MPFNTNLGPIVVLGYGNGSWHKTWHKTGAKKAKNGVLRGNWKHSSICDKPLTIKNLSTETRFYPVELRVGGMNEVRPSLDAKC